MNLIERYVYEVGQNLSGKNRQDIEKEIRSLIEDSLEARTQSEGRPADDEMMVSVLKEFGPPEKMAASYQQPRYLIGPRLYPTFWLVLRVVLLVLLVIFLVILAINLGEPPYTVTGLFQSKITALADLVASALSALGNVVLIFAILEWALPKTSGKPKEWDPRKLKDREDAGHVRTVPMLVGIAGSVVMILLFNFWPKMIVSLTPIDGKINFVPMVGDNFNLYLPYLNLLYVLEIALNVIVLRAGSWKPVTRWLQAGTKVLALLVLAAMLLGPGIIQIDTTALHVAPGSTLDLFYRALETTGVRSALMLIMLLTVWELGKILYRMRGKKIRV
jgi:hypothetical protein